MSKLKWNKEGFIYKPDGRFSWSKFYAQKPSVIVNKDRMRIFYATRPDKEHDGSYTSNTSFIDVDSRNPSNVLYVHDKPLLSLGVAGSFDQHAVIPGCIISNYHELWFYYIGWMRCVGVPYTCAIGLAKSIDGGTSFRRVGKGPLLERTLQEPYFIAGAYVLQTDNLFHMWYSSGTDWIVHEGRLESTYVLMHATSMDGIVWKRDAEPCVPAIVENECQGFASVIKYGDKYHMWFSWRYPTDFRDNNRGYRIGHAWSDDLQRWHRDDNGLLNTSHCGWDSQMVCYPCVVSYNNKVIMFYCGNHFGLEGIGYATLQNIV